MATIIKKIQKPENAQFNSKFNYSNRKRQFEETLCIKFSFLSFYLPFSGFSFIFHTIHQLLMVMENVFFVNLFWIKDLLLSVSWMSSTYFQFFFALFSVLCWIINELFMFYWSENCGKSCLIDFGRNFCWLSVFGRVFNWFCGIFSKIKSEILTEKVIFDLFSYLKTFWRFSLWAMHKLEA